MSHAKTYRLPGSLLLLGLSLPLLSCTSAPGGLEAQIDASPAPSTAPDLSEYRVVEDFQVTANAQTHTDPKALALNVFGYREPAEGNFQETVELISQTPDKAVVRLTQANLPDDSVRSVRYRIEMVPVSSSSREWQMAWVGSQTQCWPERGHQDWSKQPCF